MNCIVCSNSIDEIKVAKTPVSGYRCKSADESMSQPRFDLIFQYCSNCNMINYRYNEDADPVLDKLYSEHTATYYLTKQMTDYLNNFTEELISEYNINNSSNVLEIGCNSGRLLSVIRNKSGCRVLGVEPSKTFSEIWKKEGIEVINDYFGEEVAAKLSNEKFDAVIFRHVYEHIKDPVAFLNTVASVCDDNTALVIEVPYFKTVLERKRIENISYSHLNYFTISSVNKIAEKFNMGITKYKLVDTDGGAIVIHLKKGIVTDDEILDKVSLQEIKDFISYIDEAKIKAKNIAAKYNNDEIVGYGAGAKGQHLIYILGLEEYIKYVVDDTPGYEDLLIPGTSIIIKNSKLLESGKIKAVINLAPTHSAAIREKVPEGIDFIELI